MKIKNNIISYQQLSTQLLCHSSILAFILSTNNGEKSRYKSYTGRKYTLIKCSQSDGMLDAVQ